MEDDEEKFVLSETMEREGKKVVKIAVSNIIISLEVLIHSTSLSSRSLKMVIYRKAISS